MKYLMIVATLVICSCNNETANDVAGKKQIIEDARTKELQDKYVSKDSDIIILRKMFDEVLFKHDSLTAYTPGLEDMFEAESRNIIKSKQKINLLLLRQTITNEEKRIADSLIKKMDKMVADLRIKATK